MMKATCGQPTSIDASAHSQAVDESLQRITSIRSIGNKSFAHGQH
eukprot:CAMPEP_0169273230 /NCGR_PEP_ID=MMETSP1016-20121227/50969_1 /TAXON_ID=342587 /ORGANISM="Karlodinium micrum, Strain CCMP2283" /LENGTH=44 /DNA_ID= /DNA_START= /DNA_END= /DNA_ORIENTATION=